MQLQTIQTKIYEFRGIKLMLDFDLAELYGVETRVLNQVVKRNIDRFPLDFMFQLKPQEYEALKPEIESSTNSSQNVMSLRKHRGKSYAPYACTEQGVAMISSVLGSKKAIEVNVWIIRAFVWMRQMVFSSRELTQKLNEIERIYDKKFKDVYHALNYLMDRDKEAITIKNRTKIGFKN